MSYPKQTAKLRPTRGVTFDVPPAEVGPEFWTGARNVHFRDAFAERIMGERDAYVSPIAGIAPGEFLHAHFTGRGGSAKWLLFEADGSCWSIEGSTYTDIDPTALLGPSQFSFEFSSTDLNSVPVISNSNDEPVYYNGASLVELPGWTATESCRYIAAFKFHLFALNIDGPAGSFENLVKWSAAAEPGTVPDSWTPAPDNDAGSVELADSPGAVLCALPMADVMLFYKRQAIYQATYSGGNRVFTFRKVESEQGALGPMAVCDIGDKHFVVGDGDMYIFDGSQPVFTADSRVKDYFYSQLEDAQFAKVFCVYNRPKGEVLVCFPTKGQEYPNQALVYDVQSDAFGLRDLPFSRRGVLGVASDDDGAETWENQTETWDATTETWGDTTVSLARSSLVFINEKSMLLTDAEAAKDVAAVVGKHSMAFGDGARLKFVKRLHVRTAPASGTFFVRVGSQMTPDEQIAWSPEVQLDSPEQIVNTFAMGRYISVEVRSSGPTVWKLTGIDLELELRGYH